MALSSNRTAKFDFSGPYFKKWKQSSCSMSPPRAGYYTFMILAPYVYFDLTMWEGGGGVVLKTFLSGCCFKDMHIQLHDIFTKLIFLKYWIQAKWEKVLMVYKRRHMHFQQTSFVSPIGRFRQLESEDYHFF